MRECTGFRAGIIGVVAALDSGLREEIITHGAN